MYVLYLPRLHLILLSEKIFVLLFLFYVNRTFLLRTRIYTKKNFPPNLLSEGKEFLPFYDFTYESHVSIIH